jgi:Zn-finger nucleic acid-binding protein
MKEETFHHGIRSSKKCPRCDSRLYMIERGGVRLDHCWECGGIWFEKHELDELVDDDGTLELLIEITGKLKGESLLCPECREMMSTHEVFGVYVDQCPECKGVWMDKGETEKVWEMEERIKHPFGIGVDDPRPEDFWDRFKVKYYGFEKVKEK